MKALPAILVLSSLAILGGAAPAFSELVEAEGQTKSGMPTSSRSDGSIDVEVSAEAANELRAVLRSGRNKPTSQEAAPANPPVRPSVDYDAEIKKARAAGNPIKAAILRGCKDAPAGGAVSVPPSYAALMQDYCKDRDFNIVVDRRYVTTGDAFGPLPDDTSEARAGKSSAKLAACRAEARKHIVSCAKVTDYQNCELSGCPETILCDKRLTKCDDHGSSYDRSGEFYCDTRDWRTRDFDLEKVLERACPL